MVLSADMYIIKLLYYISNCCIGLTLAQEIKLPYYYEYDEFDTIYEDVLFQQEDKYGAGKFAVLQDLRKGEWITNLRSLLGNITTLHTTGWVCDIEKMHEEDYDNEEDKSYMPSICVLPKDCSTPVGSETLKQSHCGYGQQCCRVDQVEILSNFTFKPFRELPHNMNYTPGWSIIGQYQPDDLNIFEKAWDAANFNQSLLDMFPVCGIAPVSNTTISLFFCTREDLCLPTEEAVPSPSDKTQTAMNKFCEFVPLEDYFPSRSNKRLCCESSRIKQLSIKDKKTSIDIHPFTSVPHVPLYLKYAPGFRASYMCEAYGRMLCEEKIDTCQYPCAQDRVYTKQNNFSHNDWVDGSLVYGEIPHQALVGVYHKGLVLFFHCGGSLISRRWVLSTRRCVSYVGLDSNVIMLGMRDTLEATELNKNEVLLIIIEILVYPFDDKVQAEDRTTLYDYSLLKTHDEVNFTKFVKPACLYHTDPPVNWEELFFTGFGGNFSRAVKRVKFPLIYSDESPKSKRDGYCVSRIFDPYDPYYSKFGVGLSHIICGNGQTFSRKEPKYPSPCKHDEGGPLQFRVPIPYCMYQVYAVLSLKRSKCDSPSSMSAFQSIKFAMPKIEDIVWKYPFLEDFPMPFANPKNFKNTPLWYDECESKRCPTVEIVKKHLHEEPKVIHKTNYNITTANDLNKGALPEVFDESSLMLGGRTLCDVERYDKGESLAFKQAVYKYIPAFCVDESTICTSQFGGNHSTEACKRDDKVCCSIANQPAVTGALGHHINLIAHDELFGYRFHDDVVFTGEAQNQMTEEQYITLQHEQIREVLETESVCGVKAYLYPNNQTFLTPFFCTSPNKCKRDLKPEERRKRLDHTSWADICRRASEFDTSLSGKTSCCHPSDILFEDYVKNSVKWEFRELPTYLKYAPGLRSAYKCEEYYRYVCENVNNWCVHYREEDFAIPGEIPHMAQIGFIVPKMMLFYCGGTIISPRYVISSTTCGMEREIVANVVLVGDFNRTILIDNPGWEKLYPLREILPYPFKRKLPVPPRGVVDNDLRNFFLENGRDNDRFVDLALYRTIDDIVFSPRIRPICLYYNPVDKIDLAWFTGFGYLPYDKNDLRTYYKANHFIRSKLMKVAEVYINRGLDLTLLPHEERFKEVRKRWDECKNPSLFKKDEHHPYYTKYGVADHYLFCGENTNPVHGPCRYDDGGPLQVELATPYCSSQLIGVLSVGHVRCNDTHPLVYVNTTKFIKEIEDVVFPYPFLDFITEGTPKCLSQHAGGVNLYAFLHHIDS